MAKEVKYIAEPDLQSAVEVALELQLPLLVTGEPGTGKTLLAKWVAQEYLKTSVLRFNTKTTSIARDLFYRYDAIRHFRQAHHHHQGDEHVSVNPLDFVQFEALGLAIMASQQQRFVVLIDEVDKAPRDFSNDVLYEFENLAFRIEEANLSDFAGYNFDQKAELARLGLKNLNIAPDELGSIRHSEEKDKPFLLLTSNSEKNLPDAFLRRCVFYHINFPKKETLSKIIRANVKLSKEYDDMLDDIIGTFEKIREMGLRKKPATAELEQWVSILQTKGVDVTQLNKEQVKKELWTTFPVLAKNREDMEKLKRL